MMDELVAKFISSIRSGVAPLTVNFTNYSTGPFTSVQWDFGDGSTSTEINPSHQYLSEGTFQVTLTIYDSEGNSNVSRGVITVFAESSENSETVQRGLYVAKRFDSGQVQVKKETTSGSTFSTLYPYSGTHELSYGQNGVYELGIIGGPSMGVALSTELYYSASTLDSADFVSFVDSLGGTDDLEGYIAIAQGGPSGETSLNRWDDIFDGSSDPKPVQIFKVRTIDTGSTPTLSGGPLTIDRTPALWTRDTADPSGMTNSVLIVTKTGSTSGTYDTDKYRYFTINLGVDSYDDFEITTGLTNIDNSYAGTLNYFGLDANSGQTAAIGTINYSGYSASDKFSPGTIELSLPWVMWHNSSTPGIALYDLFGDVEYDENTSHRFKYLRDGTTASDNIVGKVFYDKKAVVITDKELNAVLNFTSNRNWTLPEPEITSNGTGGDNTTGLAYYITYYVEDETSRAGGGVGHGFHVSQPIHCRYTQRIVPSVEGQTFRIKADDSPWVADDLLAGTGFSQNEIFVVMGTGTTSSTHPAQDSLYYSAMSVSSLSSGVNLPDYTDFVAANDEYNAWQEGADNEYMPYGSHGLGLGYLSGSFETTIYKMAVTCVAKNTEFNATQNETFNDLNTNENVYITEVALYNEQNELLMVGKLNKPIKKNDERYVTIKMEVDL